MRIITRITGIIVRSNLSLQAEQAGLRKAFPQMGEAQADLCKILVELKRGHP